jgi:hypothetical protein
MPDSPDTDPFRALCDLCEQQNWHLFITPYKDGTVFVSVYTDDMKLSDEPLVALWEPLPAEEAFLTTLERAEAWLAEFREWAGADTDARSNDAPNEQG